MCVLCMCRPLQMSIWLDILIPDVYHTLCSRCGCEPIIDLDQIEEEVERSLSSATPTQAFRNALPINSSFEEAMLTPLRERVRSQTKYLDVRNPILFQGTACTFLF